MADLLQTAAPQGLCKCLQPSAWLSSSPPCSYRSGPRPWTTLCRAGVCSEPGSSKTTMTQEFFFSYSLYCRGTVGMHLCRLTCRRCRGLWTSSSCRSSPLLSRSSSSSWPSWRSSSSALPSASPCLRRSCSSSSACCFSMDATSTVNSSTLL